MEIGRKVLDKRQRVLYNVGVKGKFTLQGAKLAKLQAKAKGWDREMITDTATVNESTTDSGQGQGQDQGQTGPTNPSEGQDSNPGSAQDGQDGTVAEGNKPKRNQIAFNTQPDLYAAVNEAAKAQGVSAASYVRSLLGERFGITIVATPSRVKRYATKEEAIAARKDADSKRRATLKRLMELYKSGKISLDDGAAA